MTLSPSAQVSAPTDLELTLAQIEGVYASRVVLDASRNICEMHIVTSTARQPKRIIRDVVTLLYVKHGIKVDYRKVSLVQLKQESLLRLPMARPEICQVVEDAVGDYRRIRVEIQAGGKRVTGEARERIENLTPIQTSAQATVSALEQLIGHRLNVRIENATTVRLDARELVIVVLNCLVDDREEALVGASFAGTRLAESAARATLDALNRRMHKLAG